MNPLLRILLVLSGGGGFYYMGGPIYGGSALSLIFIIGVVAYFFGCTRCKS